MAPISGSQKVALLNNCGLKVDEDGVVTDWQDSPARHPRPVGQNEGVRAARHAFSAQDDEILRLWCTAANAEGLTGNRVFERLEATVSSSSFILHAAVGAASPSFLKSSQLMDSGYSDLPTRGKHTRTGGASRCEPCRPQIWAPIAPSQA